MDVQPIDQGAVLRSGQAAIPNYAEQAMQQALLGVQQQQAQTASQGQQRLQAQFGRETQRQDAFSQAVAALGPNPPASALAALAIQFPEFSEAVKRGYDTMDTARQRTEFQAMAQITHAARQGNFTLAAQLLRTRVEADRAAGQPDDPADAAILAGLESHDDNERRSAVDLLERTTSAVNPQLYAQTYGTFQRRTGVIDNILVDLDTGQAITQSPYPRVRWGPDGASATFNPVPGIPQLGVDGAGGGGPSAAGPSPGQDIPQGAETPSPNGIAPAFAAGSPMTVEDNRSQYPADNPNTPQREVSRGADPRASLPTGNPLDGQMSGGTEVVRVRSIQEARALPPGTRYMTPDHRVFMR